MLVAKYTCNASGVLPTFNDGYVYEVNETNDGNGIYTIEITSDNDFSSCSFNGKGNLLAVEYLKVTSNVIYMQNMFRDCSSLTSLDLSNWNTSEVTNMYAMFNSCKSLTTLDVSNFNTSNVSNMNYMFSGCNSLTSLDVSNFNTSNVTNMGDMFSVCNNLISLDVSNFNTSNVTSMFSMFGSCNKLTSLDLSNFNTSNVINMEYMFRGCSSLTSLDVSNFNTNNVTDMSYMFSSCQSLTSIDVSNWNTSKVTNMKNMFYNCNKLTSLDVSNFDTSKVTNMQYMFPSCNSLTSLDISKWDTSKVTNMGSMFYNCNKLTSLDLSNWDTSNVVSMESMFYNCQSLTSLDVSNFDTSKVTDMSSIIPSTPNLTEIGMLYCSKDTVNKISSAIDNGNKNIWVLDTLSSDYTDTNYVTFKDYKESSVNNSIYLNSPLLDGDKMVVKNGKLCHYHKMGMITFNGSEDEKWSKYDTKKDDMCYAGSISLGDIIMCPSETQPNIFSPTHKTLPLNYIWKGDSEGVSCGYTVNRIFISLLNSRLVENNIDGFKQWLSENPTTIIYELAEPWYEEITSNWIVETFEESNLEIFTNLPIKINLSYLTNVPSIYGLSRRVSETKESNNILYNMVNLLDGEIDNN